MLLMRGADPSKADVKGTTPLMYSCRYVSCLRVLLEAGAHVNDKNVYGSNALTLLIELGDNVTGAELLQQYGTDLNYQRDASFGYFSVIHLAVAYYRPQVVSWLLDHDVDIEACGDFEATPLLTFVSNSQGCWLDIFGMLIRKRPNYQAIDEFHEGLLHYIARFGSLQYMTTLREQADLSGLDVERKSISDLIKRKRSIPGKTAQQLAEWRRDHQSEWAIESSMSLDPDPYLW